jgi:hypothetical protein
VAAPDSRNILAPALLEPPIHGHAAPHLQAMMVLTGFGAWDGGTFFLGLAWLGCLI